MRTGFPRGPKGRHPHCRERGPDLEKIPEPIRRSLAFTLARAAHRVREGVERSLEPLGIRGPHLFILMMMRADGPMSQAALTKRLWIDRTTMVHIIDDLERLGLVERTRDPNDRRANAVRVSPRGEEVLARAGQLAHAGEAGVMSALSPEEQEQLRSLLARLAGDG
jgi:DNA-binding MarR family transcriptional regulator